LFDPISAAFSAVLAVFSKVFDLGITRKAKPHFILNPTEKIKAVIIHCFIETANTTFIHPEGSGYKIAYIANRLVIKNKGNSAALNCQGYLVKDSSRERIAWSESDERSQSSIPPHSTKELDLCALLFIALDVFNKDNHTSFNETQITELALRLEVPRIISHTKAGFQGSPFVNRRIQTGNYLVEVTCMNADPLTIPIVITDRLARHGIFVHIRS
jgi:hypothetical protein